MNRTLHLLCLLAILLAGCAAYPATPTIAPPLPTTTATPASPTATPTLPSPLEKLPAVTLAAPKTISTPEVKHQLIADFETCGDMMGTDAPEGKEDNWAEYTCVEVPDSQGLVAQVDFNAPEDWAAFWIDLAQADFTQYDTLTFYARRESGSQNPQTLKLELKGSENEQMGLHYATGMTGEWQQFTIPLAQFVPVEDATFLCDWMAMNKLTFVFEPQVTGTSGRIYLDDIFVERRSGGAPPPPQLCFSTPTSSVTSVPELTGSSTPRKQFTPTPGNTPTATGTPVPGEYWMIADFNSCNDLGGRMGVSAEYPNALNASYPPEAGRGCVAKLGYDVEDWSSFWINLNDMDMTPYTQLVFDVRGDVQLGIPDEVKVELSRANGEEVSIQYFSGINEGWKTITLYLNDFEPDEFSNGLSNFTEMELLFFTFEYDSAGPEGGIYLDNVRLLP